MGVIGEKRDLWYMLEPGEKVNVNVCGHDSDRCGAFINIVGLWMDYRHHYPDHAGGSGISAGSQSINLFGRIYNTAT